VGQGGTDAKSMGGDDDDDSSHLDMGMGQN